MPNEITDTGGDRRPQTPEHEPDLTDIQEAVPGALGGVAISKEGEGPDEDYTNQVAEARLEILE